MFGSTLICCHFFTRGKSLNGYYCYFTVRMIIYALKVTALFMILCLLNCNATLRVLFTTTSESGCVGPWGGGLGCAKRAV